MIVIARLTVRELVRRRVVWVLAALTILSVALVAWGLDRLVSLARADGTNELEIRIGVSQVLIMIAFMFSFVLAMTAAFVGRAGDRRRARIGGRPGDPGPPAPPRRGPARSLARVGASSSWRYTIASGSLAIAVATQIAGYGPPEPILAVAFLSGQALVLLTLTLALGSVLPSIAAGAIAVVGFGLGWMAGVLAGVAAAFGVGLLGQVAEISRWIFPSDGLWRGVIYGLEPPLVVLMATGNLPRFADANPFYASAPPPLPFVVWSIVWIALVLGISSWWFERRDL